MQEIGRFTVSVCRSAKMYRLIINCFISISVLNLVQGNTGETPDGTIIDTPEELPTLAQCKLKSVDGGSVKGVPELQGPKGPPGEVGSPGIKGEIGPQGQEGPKGNDGATGEPGSNGLPGIKGIIGLQGDQGETGVQGKAGPAGIKGILGQKGSRGDPGFAVYKLSEDKSSKDDVETRGSKKNPLREVCKYEGAVPEADKHYLQPRTGSDLWQVHCENKNLETCILPKSPVTIEIKSDKPFWLSEIAGSAVDNLYGVTIEQLEWLQRRSAFIKQTIRYYCFNSVPIHDDESKTLKLLTWNNVIIGEKPSATTPFYYEVIKDECKNSKDKKDGSKYTEIEIKSSNVNRLPILDIQINDVNGGDQKHMIEHIKLCFM